LNHAFCLLKITYLKGARHVMTACEFALFDCAIAKRGRVRRWSVSDNLGTVLLLETERTRPAAQYMAARAMFQLLLTTRIEAVRAGPEAERPDHLSI
jgi:hypothetical protein